MLKEGLSLFFDLVRASEHGFDFGTSSELVTYLHGRTLQDSGRYLLPGLQDVSVRVVPIYKGQLQESVESESFTVDVAPVQISMFGPYLESNQGSHDYSETLMVVRSQMENIEGIALNSASSIRGSSAQTALTEVKDRSGVVVFNSHAGPTRNSVVFNSGTESAPELSYLLNSPRLLDLGLLPPPPSADRYQFISDLPALGGRCA